jgi:hypothetical protein
VQIGRAAAELGSGDREHLGRQVERGGGRARAFALDAADETAVARMARELGPKGVHVAHFTVSGTMDGEAARQRDPSPGSSPGMAWSRRCRSASSTTTPYRQPRAAWTVEVEVRPWNEPV